MHAKSPKTLNRYFSVLGLTESKFQDPAYRLWPYQDLMPSAASNAMAIQIGT